MVEFLAHHSEFAFKRHVFESALADFRKGYIKLPDTAMMDFCQSYWRVASNELPELRMVRPDVVGKDGSWIYFPPMYAGASVRLIHKFKGIGCELSIATRNAENLTNELAPFLEPDMTVRSTRSKAYVNIKTPAINHILDFSEVKADVILSLQALNRLRTFAMSEKVRQLILSAS